MQMPKVVLEGLDEAVADASGLVAQNLAWLRVLRGISIANLTTYADLGVKTWYNLLDGAYPPELKTVVGLAVVLGADVADLFLPHGEFKRRYAKTQPPRLKFSMRESDRRKVTQRRDARAAGPRQNRAKRTFPSIPSDQRERLRVVRP